VCTPNCVNRDCGTDGCGSSCGNCTVSGQFCSAAGQCTCPPATPVACGGICRGSCSAEHEARNPDTCQCCLRNTEVASGTCCSGKTFNFFNVPICKGRSPGEPCSMDEQCMSEKCYFNIFGNVCSCGGPGAVCFVDSDCCNNSCDRVYGCR
jgi:hypothetical protein